MGGATKNATRSVCGMLDTRYWILDAVAMLEKICLTTDNADRHGSKNKETGGIVLIV